LLRVHSRYVASLIMLQGFRCLYFIFFILFFKDV
jgi:hypothetical protein